MLKDKVKNIYTVVSKEASTDSVDHMNSIIKIIDKFTFAYNPKELSDKKVVIGKDPILFNAQYAIATAWYLGEKLKEPTSFSMSVNLVDANGNEHGGPQANNIEVPAGFDKCCINLLSQGMPVIGAGSFKFIATLRSKSGEKLSTGEYHFDVELVEQTQA